MKPSEELEFLNNFIKLTEEQAIKRNMLEGFIDNRDKILLLDSDSILYKVVHFWVDKEPDLVLMFEDFCNQIQEMVNTIEYDGFNIIDIQYYFTTCRSNFRHELTDTYKANREDNPLRELAIELMHYALNQLKELGMYVDHSDTLEADDLISIYVKEYGHKNVITCSIDKDLKQIVGAHFDYFKVKTEQIDVFGEQIREYKGWRYTTPQEGLDLFLEQMLIGDKSDNVEGVKGIGKVKAPKLLEDKTNFSKLLTVARLYDDMDRVRLNVKLMRL